MSNVLLSSTVVEGTFTQLIKYNYSFDSEHYIQVIQLPQHVSFNFGIFLNSHENEHIKTMLTATLVFVSRGQLSAGYMSVIVTINTSVELSHSCTSRAKVIQQNAKTKRCLYYIGMLTENRCRRLSLMHIYETVL